MEYFIRFKELGQDERVFSNRDTLHNAQALLNYVYEHLLQENKKMSYCIQMGRNQDETRLCWFFIYDGKEPAFSLSGSIHEGEAREKVENAWREAHLAFLKNSKPLSPSVQCFQYENQVCLFCDTWFFSGTIEQEMDSWENAILLPY